jgi:polyisoprenoid-binding protein YceI
MTDLSSATGTWNLDPTHTTVGFHARHAMVAKVRGAFTEVAGSVTLDGADPAASSATLTIQAASIHTANADRDGHLKSGDFLDVETYPTLTFTSTAVQQTGPATFVVTGDLTIRGVTKSVDVTFDYLGTSTDPWGNLRVGFEGRAEISRKDFGLVWNVALEGGGILVGDTVRIEIDAEAVKAS